MSPAVLFGFVIGYFVLLLGVAWFTSRNSNNDSFFIGNRNSNWMLVAFGMIGTSFSGVTFVSVPVVWEQVIFFISRSFWVFFRLCGDRFCTDSAVLPDEPDQHLYLSRKKAGIKCA